MLRVISGVAASSREHASAEAQADATDKDGAGQ